MVTEICVLYELSFACRLVVQVVVSSLLRCLDQPCLFQAVETGILHMYSAHESTFCVVILLAG